METLRSEAPALAEAIARRAAEWMAEFGADFPGDMESGLLGESDEERERFEDYANDAACPALDPATGRCDVYEWRPMTCRVFGPPVRTETSDGQSGLGHCELCFAGASDEQISRCEMPVPLEQEQQLLESLAVKGETIVAIAVLRGDTQHKLISARCRKLVLKKCKRVPCWIEIRTRALEDNFRFLKSLAPIGCGTPGDIEVRRVWTFA